MGSLYYMGGWGIYYIYYDIYGIYNMGVGNDGGILWMFIILWNINYCIILLVYIVVCYVLWMMIIWYYLLYDSIMVL